MLPVNFLRQLIAPTSEGDGAANLESVDGEPSRNQSKQFVGGRRRLPTRPAEMAKRNMEIFMATQAFARANLACRYSLSPAAAHDVGAQGRARPVWTKIEKAGQ